MPKCTRSVPHFEITVLFVHFAMLPVPDIRRHFPTTAPLESAERLEHEKIETTLNTYSHLYPSTQSKLAGLLDMKHKEKESKGDDVKV